jgi:3-isopropylmalate dehydrogenase
MNYKIAVLPGDGIGPEIVAQAIKVLKKVGIKFNHNFEFKEAIVGACAIDAVGDPFPDETFKLCMESDAVLFGAIGDPKYDNDPKAKVRPEQGLACHEEKAWPLCQYPPGFYLQIILHKSPLRKDLVEGADFVVVRELDRRHLFW